MDAIPARAAGSARGLLTISHIHRQASHQSAASSAAVQLEPSSNADPDEQARVQDGDLELGGAYGHCDIRQDDPAAGQPAEAIAHQHNLQTGELMREDFVLLAKIRDACEENDMPDQLRAVLSPLPLWKRRFLIDFNLGQAGGNIDDSLCAIHHLVWDCKPEHIEVLLELGGNVDALTIKPYFTDGSPYHQTALHVACTLAQEDLVKLLYEHGADTNLLDSDGLTPLQRLVEKKTAPLARVLGCLKHLLPEDEPGNKDDSSTTRTRKCIPVDKTKLGPGALTRTLMARAKTSPIAAEALEFLLKRGYHIPDPALAAAKESADVVDEEGLLSLTNHQKAIRHVIFAVLALMCIGGVSGFMSTMGKFDISACETIYGQVILTPYLILILNQFFFRFFKWFFEMALLPMIYRTMGVYCCSCCFLPEGSRSRSHSSSQYPSASAVSSPLQLAASEAITPNPAAASRSPASTVVRALSFRQQKMDFELRGLRSYIRCLTITTLTLNLEEP